MYRPRVEAVCGWKIKLWQTWPSRSRAEDRAPTHVLGERVLSCACRTCTAAACMPVPLQCTGNTVLKPQVDKRNA